MRQSLISLASASVARRASDRLAKAHVVELGRLRGEADLDVAQALPVRQLRESHRPELVLAREALDRAITAVTRHSAPKGVHRQVVDQLREHQLALVHVHAPAATPVPRGNAASGPRGSSSR
jgi:hypothetical protein